VFDVLGDHKALEPTQDALDYLLDNEEFGTMKPGEGDYSPDGRGELAR